MNIWLVTTGSSDVQLTCDEHWNDWYPDVKKSLYGLRFDPARAIEDEGEPCRLPARVLGIAYNRLPNEVRPHLAFPLLKGFTRSLKDQGTRIDRIVILMSDQENIFPEAERETTRCPYWQDTCQLYPILEGYFQEHFPEATLTPLMLKPDCLEQGLDDWDAVLSLVRREISSLDIKPKTVYVSHQAGTPAISSAVQFASLAKFGSQVQFLVSSEYNSDRSRKIASSKYLSAIRVQEAKALLDRYDYEGVQTLLLSLQDTKHARHKRLRTLLKAAIEWNHAEFQKFRDILLKEGVLSKGSFPWWRSGYESAYLAVIRLRQGNTVDALFHSFRSFEGSLIVGVRNYCKEHIKKDQKYGWQIQSTIRALLPGYRNQLYKDQQDKLDQNRLGLFGTTVSNLFGYIKPEFEASSDIQVALTSAKKQRDIAFHNIEGLQESEVFDAWQANNFKEWVDRMLKCLNLVSGEAFESLEKASLMTKVHQDLEAAIAAYELQP